MAAPPSPFIPQMGAVHIPLRPQPKSGSQALSSSAAGSGAGSGSGANAEEAANPILAAPEAVSEAVPTAAAQSADDPRSHRFAWNAYMLQQLPDALATVLAMPVSVQ
jgi:hypothetical protein